MNELPIDKRAFLKNLTKQKVAATEIFPVSSAQERMWMIDRLTSNPTGYHIHKAFDLIGELHIENLTSAIHLTIAAHPGLRTTFATVSDVPIQIVHLESYPQFKLKFRDLCEMPRIEQDELVKGILREHANEVFDLTKLYLFSIVVIKFSAARHIVSFTYHHIITDGWANKLIYSDISKYYQSLQHGISISGLASMHHSALSKSQRELENSPLFDQQFKYWQLKLQKVQFTKLDHDFLTSQPPDETGANEHLELDLQRSTNIRAFCKKEQITPFVFFASVFNALLYRYTRMADICLGIPLANRRLPGSEKVVGLLLNTLVTRSIFDHTTTFDELIAIVRKDCALTYDNQDLPFEKLLKAAGFSKDQSIDSRIPIFFNMLDLPTNTLDLVGLHIKDFFVDVARPAKYEITFYVNPQKTTIHLTLNYRKTLFNPARMKAFLAQYEMFLRGVLADKSKRLSQYDLTIEPNTTPEGDSRAFQFQHGLIHQSFLFRAAVHPKHPALAHGNEYWNYEELDRESNRLSHRLLEMVKRRNGVICVYSKRNAHLVWAMLGILKSGCAMVVLDPSHPKSYTLSRLEQLKLDGLIEIDIPEDASLLADLSAANPESFCISIPNAVKERTQQLFADYDASAPIVDIQQGDIAHIFFTSGTNGKSKGVKAKHGPVAHFLNWYLKTFPVSSSDRISLLSGLSHDPMIRDVFVPLSSGATLFIPTDREAGIGRVGAWLRHNMINIVHLTPSLAQVIVDELAPFNQRLDSAKYFFFAGERLNIERAQSVTSIAPQATLVNFYGATETPQAMAFYVLYRDRKFTFDQRYICVPVGKGIEDVDILILNKANKVCSVYEVGEICIRSKYLSDGYIESTQILENPNFIANPLTDDLEDVIYRTGDLGKYLHDGNVVVIGREDSQIKIRGFRIYLQEVHEAIVATSFTKQCVVTARDSGGDGPELIAYVVFKDGYFKEDLAVCLRRLVPDYMLPKIIATTEIALTPNGKIDTVALEVYAMKSLEVETEPMDNAVELELRRLWSEVLAIDQTSIGRNSNFFELGGHSMMAVRLILKINRHYGLSLWAGILYELTTIPALANTITPLLSVNSASEREEIEI